MMKHVTGVAIAVLLLAACESSVNGTLNVTQNFQVTNTDGQAVNVGTGSYASKLTMKNSQTLDVAIKINGDKQTVRIKLPDNTSLPTDGNGTFSIKGDDVGTKFDINGRLATDVVEGPQQQGFTTCYLQGIPPVCFPTPQGGTTCTGGGGPVQGTMQVIYHVETTTVRATAEFTSSSSAAHLASFKGSNTSSDEVYDYQGLCH